MQIVPVSRRFRHNVLQFVFFFSRSAIKQWSRILIPKNVQTHSKWPPKFPTSFYDNVKKCKIERGFVRLPKMKVSIPNTANSHVYDCNSKCRWKIPPSFSRDSWKFPSSFTDHAKSKTIHADSCSTAAIFKWRWKILPSVLHKRQKRKYSLQNHFSNRL